MSSLASDVSASRTFVDATFGFYHKSRATFKSSNSQFLPFAPPVVSLVPNPKVPPTRDQQHPGDQDLPRSRCMGVGNFIVSFLVSSQPHRPTCSTWPPPQ